MLRQCHEAGRKIDGYGGYCVTNYLMSELVLLRFMEIMDKDDNEIFEGPYTVVDHNGHNGRRQNRREHRYIEDQYLEEGELEGIIFMDLTIKQETLLLLDTLHPGEGSGRWDWAWGTPPPPRRLTPTVNTPTVLLLAEIQQSPKC